MPGYLFLMLGLLLLVGYLAAFLPGLAVLQLAWSKKSPHFGVLGLLLLAAPLILPGASGKPWGTSHSTNIAYALCFFPGLLILLYGERIGAPAPRLRAPLLYLVALFLLATIASAASKVHVGPAVFALLGIVLIAVAANLESVLVARTAGVLLLLAPVAATLTVALPRHLELNRAMQAACDAAPGMNITVAPTPVWTFALDMGSIQDGSGHVCARQRSTPPLWRYTPQHGCFTPVHEGWLTGIEVGGDGWHRHRLPPGLYLYQMRTKNEVEDLGLAPRLKEQACAWSRQREGVEHCIGFGPVESLTADYLLRRRPSVPRFDSVYSESFEIVGRASGESLGQTTGFYETDGNRDSLLAAPLQHLLPREKACAENGPPLLDFLKAFVEGSREPAGQSSSR